MDEWWACAVTRDRSPMAEMCRACGSEIARRSKFQAPFCSPLCGTAAMFIARSQMNALVTCSDEGVRCNLCSLVFQNPGQHMRKVHGLEVRKNMSRTERLTAYGLPEGSRLSSVSLRDDQRKRLLLLRSKGIVIGNVFRKGHAIPGRPRLPQSAAQLATTAIMRKALAWKRGK